MDDLSDTTGRAVTITSDSITGLAPAAIEYGDADLQSLSVFGSNAASTYLILGTPATSGLVAGTPTNLTCGPNNDIVNIEGTSAETTLNVDGGGGSDTVNVNDGFASAQAVDGSVFIQNSSGSFDLRVFDNDDGTGRTAFISSDSITGLAPGLIRWDTNSINALFIDGPAGPSTFTFVGTPSNVSQPVLTTLTDDGSDQVFVQNTSGIDGASLTIDPVLFGTSITLGEPGSGVHQIAGAVTINPLNNSAPILTVDDSGDTTGGSVTISSTSITGLGGAHITYAGLGALNVVCGTGFYGIAVQSTAAPLTLNGGGSTDLVTIGNSSSVQAINAPVTLLDPSGEMFLEVDDSADGVPRGNVVITSDSITGLAPATISYAENDLATLVVDGSKASSSYAITGTPASSLRTVATSLTGGPNADFVLVEGTAAETSLNVDASGADDTVQIDDNFTDQAILGTVSIQGPSGSVHLGLFDEGDGIGRTATISASGITGLAPAGISWTAGSLASLSVLGPTAPSTFIVTGTPSSPVATTLSDEADDQVLVQNLSAIAGVLNLQPLNNAAPILTVDDSADSAVRTANIGSTGITGLSPAAITYTGSQLSSLTVEGGSGRTTFAVTNPLVATTLRAGTGSLSVGGSQSVRVTSFAGSQINVVAGNDQSAAADVTFAVPLEVQVTDAFGNPVAGAAVLFAAPTGGPGGHFTGSATLTTNDLGLATEPIFSGNGILGTFTVDAIDVADGIATSFQLTNLVGAPALLTVIGSNTQNTPIGAPYATLMQVEVTDAFNNPVANVPVTFTAPAVGVSGTFNALPTVPTNALGIATAPAFTANQIEGSFTVTALANGISSPATFTLTNTAVPASISVAAGSAQTATVGGAAFAKPLSVQVDDAHKDPVSGITVVFALSASGPGGTFAGSAAVVTNAGGVATAPALTPNTVAGTFTVVASVAGVSTPVSFTLTNTPGAPAAIMAVAGTPQVVAVTKAFQPLKAEVVDRFGNAISGVKVTFTAPKTGATGTFGGSATATALSGANGVATAPALTANSQLGSFTVTATATGVGTSASFALTNVPLAIKLVPRTRPQSASSAATFAAPLPSLSRAPGSTDGTAATFPAIATISGMSARGILALTSA